MIVNLTDKPLRLYDPDTPDVLTGDDEAALLNKLEPATTPARLDPIDLEYAADVHHAHRAYDAHLVAYRRVTGLPDAEHHVYLVVDITVVLAAPGRPDLLIPTRPVRDEGGAVLGYRRLTSAA